MNPETILAEVGQKMMIAAIGSTGPVRICWLDGKFVCLNSSDRQTTELVIACYSPDQIVKGLSSDEWRTLSKRLMGVHKIKTQGV